MVSRKCLSLCGLIHRHQTWYENGAKRKKEGVPVLRREPVQRTPVLGHGGQHHVLVALELVRDVIQRDVIHGHRGEHEVLVALRGSSSAVWPSSASKSSMASFSLSDAICHVHL